MATESPRKNVYCCTKEGHNNRNLTGTVEETGRKCGVLGGCKFKRRKLDKVMFTSEKALE